MPAMPCWLGSDLWGDVKWCHPPKKVVVDMELYAFSLGFFQFGERMRKIPIWLKWWIIVILVDRMLFLLLVRWKISDATEDVPNCWCFPPWQGGIFLQKPLFRRHCNRLFGGNTLQGTNMSHLGKRKIIFKSDFWWDMLVPRRVFHKIPSFYSKHLVSLPAYPMTRSPQ